jgi:hypothetical protein
MLAIEAMLEGEAEALTRKAIEMAMNGDVVALRLCVERAAPLRKGRPVVVDLPPIDTAKDVVGAVGAIVSSVGEGMLTPDEGQTLASILDTHRRAIETQELETRIATIEAVPDNFPPSDDEVRWTCEVSDRVASLLVQQMMAED